MKRAKLNFIPNFELILFGNIKKLLLASLIFVLFFLSPYQQAQSKNSSKKKKETPTRIRSDVIDIKRKSQTIDFLGNVVVEKEDSSMLAKKMTVFYEEKSQSKPGSKSKASQKQTSQKKQTSIKRINAKDDVKIFSEEFIATGSTGYYDPKKNFFVLEKDVLVNNGTSIASGDKFIYNLNTKKGHFVGKRLQSSITARERVVVIIGDDIKSQGKSQKKSK